MESANFEEGKVSTAPPSKACKGLSGQVGKHSTQLFFFFFAVGRGKLARTREKTNGRKFRKLEGKPPLMMKCISYFAPRVLFREFRAANNKPRKSANNKQPTNKQSKNKLNDETEKSEKAIKRLSPA